MRFRIVTLFPEMFGPLLEQGILGRALNKGLIEIDLISLRDFAVGTRYRRVDDYVYGGGPGLLLRPDVLQDSLRATRRRGDRLVVMTPVGRPLNRELVVGLAEEQSLLIYCGRYEGFDERFLDQAGALRVSTGDLVTMGGEVPAMLLVEAVARRKPEVLGSEDSAGADSFEHGLLEEAHYTRPAQCCGQGVPSCLVSGNHGAISRWRRRSSLKRTLEYRPDLLEGVALSEQDRKDIKQIYKELYCGYHPAN